MNLLRSSVTALILSTATACATTDQSPGSSGSTTGAATGTSGSVTSGATGASGTVTSGTSGTVTSGTTGGSGTGTTGASGAVTSGTTGSSGTVSDGGVAPGDATVPGDAGAQGCSGLPLCDGFETDTIGSAPNAALWSLVSGCGSTDPAATVTVDNSQAHSGTNSVKVVGGTNTCGPLFYNTSVIRSLGASVYGRFFVRFSVAQPVSHSAFMALGFQPDGGETSNYNFDNIEMTAQYGVFVWNYMDKTLPNAAPSASVPANTWMCFEFHTTAAGDLDTWLTSDGGAQGDPVLTMTYDPGSTPIQTGVNDSWANFTGRPSPFQFTNISFGWVTFGGGPATVWFDDIALSSTRIGCR